MKSELNNTHVVKDEKAKITFRKNNNSKDPYQPNVRGVGIVGNKYKTHMMVDGVRKPRREYMIWTDMIRRCYDEKDHIRHPTYKDCTVSDNFKSYEYFYEWCQKQKGFGSPGWQLDKDLLVPGNKIYSEDTCCFLPSEINTALITKVRSNGETLVGVRKMHGSKNSYRARCRVGKDEFIESKAMKTQEEAFQFYKFFKEQYIRKLAKQYKDSLSEMAFHRLMNFTVSPD